MPTILYEQGFRFSFYSADRGEPPHVHVAKGGGRAKWWLDPIRAQWSHGFTQADRRRILAIIRGYHGFLLDEWRRYFSQA
jgi:hypothetical protein